MNHKINRMIEKYRLIEQGDHLAVGLSGGADSVALFHFLRENAPCRNWTITALHLNHGLRGAESDRDENFVRDLCIEFDVELIIERISINEIAHRTKKSIEQCAREERYAFFDRNLPPGAKLVTAHHLDDSLETMLLNLVRGTGLRGICGIPPIRQIGDTVVVRPMLECTKKDILAYCERHSLSFVDDSTNNSNAYTRNRIRHHILPVLEQLHPGFPDNLPDTLDFLRADADYLDGQAEDALRLVSENPHCYVIERTLSLPEPIRMRVYMRMLLRHQMEPDRHRVRLLEETARRGGGGQLSAKWLVRSRDGRLVFYPPPVPEPVPLEPVAVNLPENGAIWVECAGKKLQISVVDYEVFEKYINNSPKLLKNSMDYDRISKIVKVRGRLPGDKFRQAGRGCTKSLKKLCNESGMPMEDRVRMLAVESDGELVWVEGFGVAEGRQVTATTRRVLLMEIMGD